METIGLRLVAAEAAADSVAMIVGATARVNPWAEW
jgi:hypothetical protein